MKNDIANRSDLEQLVQQFYTLAVEDPTLKPVFDKAGLNLEHHLPIIIDFWDTSLFQSDSYQRNAMQVHLDLHRKIPLTKAAFERWLHLFDATVDDLFEGQNAHTLKIRAQSIATVMQIKIARPNA